MNNVEMRMVPSLDNSSLCVRSASGLGLCEGWSQLSTCAYPIRGVLHVLSSPGRRAHSV